MAKHKQKHATDKSVSEAIALNEEIAGKSHHEEPNIVHSCKEVDLGVGEIHVVMENRSNRGDAVPVCACLNCGEGEEKEDDKSVAFFRVVLLDGGSGAFFAGIDETLEIRLRANEVVFGEKSGVLGVLEGVVLDEGRFHLRLIL